jgi:hypothetical protein
MRRRFDGKAGIVAGDGGGDELRDGWLRSGDPRRRDELLGEVVVA